MWSSLGEAYLKSGRTDEAIAALKQAIKLDPKRDSAMYYLSEAYAQRKDYGEAREMLTVLERVNHGLASEAWHNLGVAYNKAGRINEANNAFQRAERLKP